MQRDGSQQISDAVLDEEWRDITADANNHFSFTLPLEKYVLAKGGQPIRAMVKTTIYLFIYRIKCHNTSGYLFFGYTLNVKELLLFLLCLDSNNVEKWLYFSWRSVDVSTSSFLPLRAPVAAWN